MEQLKKVIIYKSFWLKLEKQSKLRKRKQWFFKLNL